MRESGIWAVINDLTTMQTRQLKGVLIHYLETACVQNLAKDSASLTHQSTAPEPPATKTCILDSQRTRL